MHSYGTVSQDIRDKIVFDLSETIIVVAFYLHIQLQYYSTNNLELSVVHVCVCPLQYYTL